MSRQPQLLPCSRSDAGLLFVRRIREDAMGRFLWCDCAVFRIGLHFHFGDGNKTICFSLFPVILFQQMFVVDGGDPVLLIVLVKLVLVLDGRDGFRRLLILGLVLQALLEL